MHYYITLLFSFCCTLSVDSSAVDHTLLERFPNANLFKSDRHHHAEIALPADAISYRNSKGDDEGYYSEKLLTVAGRSSRYVHDFSSRHTSEYLYKEFLASLSESNFETLYNCEGIGCGDLTGWQLFLSADIAGNEFSQKYILSRRQDNDGKQWFVQFYVIDLDKEPRTVLRLIEADRIPDLDIVFRTNQNTVPNAENLRLLTGEIEAIYFDFDRAELPENSSDLVSRVVDKIQESNAESILITGYADRNGPHWYNKLLATRRADALGNALKNYSELSTLNITTYGYGEVDDPESTAPDSMHRRVNVFVK
ncbi:OmpA family protein [uncultured Microbulbifer sp.]|uniref:OmpA family protein n=1 Tax=uncultured Microbulbifer sp. TaxID=348147 RepID=UPI0026307619|nr:OmpA family protein [uncultured Microbulbifer sp.]